MKAILEFNLDDPEDDMAHLRAIKSLDMAIVLWEIYYNSKKTLYSRVESENLDPYQAIDAIFDKLHDELNERGINLNQLIN
jgi:hypothetical protein